MMPTEATVPQPVDDYPLTLIQEEWLTDFFGYTDAELRDMTRAEAAALLE